MSELRTGARWYLRVALGLVLLFDLSLVSGMLSLGEPTARTLSDAPWFLLALIGRPALVLPIAAIGAGALLRFVLAPGRAGAALVALAVLGALIEARAAESGGPERFLFMGGTVLVGWIAGLAFVRAAHGDRDAEEIGAEVGAIAALAAIYVNAAVQKLAISGLGWADGDSLRMLVLAQRPFDHGALGAVSDVFVGSRALAFSLAAFTELAQLSAIAYPFHPRARAVTGTMLLAFHAGVRLLTPISFPQSMALLVVFSYPWRALLLRRGWARPDSEEMVLARHPRRGLIVLGAAFALLAALSLTPPARVVIASLSHREDAARALDPLGLARSQPSAPERAEPSFDAVAAAMLGVDALGDDVAGCTVESVARDGDDIEARFDCSGRTIVVEIVPTGSRPFHAPETAADRDLFYRSGATVSAATRDALLAELARRIAAR